MTTRCEYLREVFPAFKAELRPFRGRPCAGCNAKVPTDYAIRLGSRWHRVYVCYSSNAGTAYIVTKNHPFLVVLDGDLIGARDC